MLLFPPPHSALGGRELGTIGKHHQHVDYAAQFRSSAPSRATFSTPQLREEGRQDERARCGTIPSAPLLFCRNTPGSGGCEIPPRPLHSSYARTPEYCR